MSSSDSKRIVPEAKPADMPKRVIFFTGYGYTRHDQIADLEKVAVELSHKYFFPKVITCYELHTDSFLPKYIIKTEEFASRKSAFFAEVLYHAGLPTVRELILVIPNLSLKVLLQYLALLDEIKKQVYFAFDTSCFSSVPFAARPGYDEMIKAVPGPFKVIFGQNGMKEHPLDIANRVLEKTQRDYSSSPNSPFCLFNDIFWSIPVALKGPLFQTIFDDEEFSPVPFLKIRKALNGEFEKERTKENVLKRWEPWVTVTNNTEENSNDKTIEIEGSDEETEEEDNSKLRKTYAVCSLSEAQDGSIDRSFKIGKKVLQGKPSDEVCEPTVIIRDDNTDRARARERQKTQTVFDGSVAKLKKGPVERTDDGLPLKKKFRPFLYQTGNGKVMMSSEKSPSPIIKVEEDSDHEIDPSQIF